MSIAKLDKAIIIEEKTLTNRRDEYYKLLGEIVDEDDLEKLVYTSLHHIAFIDYLLGTEVKENKRLESVINQINKKRSTSYTLSDFHIKL
ncbi:hypothetical protein P8864_20385 [Priestia flexa]|uniref:hypothetical protein n=1 Tax=Priestia flexa TaxID=86664 RepID=UPI000C25132F|nr:hypothetical protein [Priestia flexa]MEC0668214.1 hypothetical protein [Priestia flexa]MED3826003.1 hypothetical protein [Priestia flexa]